MGMASYDMACCLPSGEKIVVRESYRLLIATGACGLCVCVQSDCTTLQPGRFATCQRARCHPFVQDRDRG
jgi:hypothetical protein